MYGYEGKHHDLGLLRMRDVYRERTLESMAESYALLGTGADMLCKNEDNAHKHIKQLISYFQINYLEKTHRYTSKIRNNSI